ncbi:hypothetical protein HYDPIDRAFT_31495 [Hydnomerulius pinastri MD-312]|uniref:CMP/dCMP-type deaminase domain-containing protein n=1 Tax=Hydnomerulius pinastri MD-312 TaxID=994086 RepID=A0A0C9WBX5_9AGAM|nr:hypothetical protein HYDPIDRAFT_31495 [Hydnomerulius pinastri MD-312]
MTYNLGAVLVKGGKIISTGHNHHRTHYDGNDVRTHGHRKPVSMHAEMHAIFNVTGMSPSFKQQHVNGNSGMKEDARFPQGSGFYGTARAPRTATKKKSTPLENVGCHDCGQYFEQAGGGRSSSHERSWGSRRRDPRVNGADLYVVRVVKSGTGSAKPCWRCVRWCSWSGVKRIFHWDPVEGRFDVTKVNSAAENDVYETQADARLFAGASY